MRDRNIKQSLILGALLPFGRQLKVSRSRNKISKPELLPKDEQTNLFFYPENTMYVRLALLRGLETAICYNINIPNLS